jgi:hypothetical protein
LRVRRNPRRGPPLRPFWRLLVKAPFVRREPEIEPQPDDPAAFEAWHRALIRGGDLPYVDIRPPR